MQARLATGLIIAATVLLGGGCGESAPGPAPGADTDVLDVAVSVPAYAWLVHQLAGPYARTVTVVSPGESPHTFSPSDAQVTKLMRCRVYLRCGVAFENSPWFKTISESPNMMMVDMRRGIALQGMEEHGHDDHDHHEDGDGLDPHIWTSAKLLKIQAGTAASALIRAAPQHTEIFKANLARLETLLTELDEELTRTLAPIRGSSFFVFHPAWGYFAQAYGLHQVAIEVQGKQPDDHEMTQLQELARAHQVRVIFVQPQVSGRSAQIVAAVIGAKVATLDPLAADVPANLRKVAKALVDAIHENGQPESEQP